MDYGALPPEINSARMYAGAGSGPLLTAGAAWDGLAEDLHSTASSYGAVISALTSDAWSGPSSASMDGGVIANVNALVTAAASKAPGAQANPGLAHHHYPAVSSNSK
jgi:PPE-repeat protein